MSDTPKHISFPNLAGTGDTSTAQAELEAAGIPIVRFSRYGECKVDVLGVMHGWVLDRRWYYWSAQASAGHEIAVSEVAAFDDQHGAYVRAHGYAGGGALSMSPSVRTFHIDTADGMRAFADFLRHRAAVVADSPELAQARERIAALGADVADLIDELARARVEITMLERRCQAWDREYREMEANRIKQRDAALARVAELEAELAEVPYGWSECKARIRADERARAERDIAAELRMRAAIPGGISAADFAHAFADDLIQRAGKGT